MNTDNEVKIKKVNELGSQARNMVDPRHFREQMKGGASFSGHETNQLWLNENGKVFREASGVSGINHGGDSRAFALLDYDRDGYQDFVMVNANRPFVQLFRNRIGDRIAAEQRAASIGLQFQGGQRSATASSEWSNRDGFGVRVEIQTQKVKLLREFRCGEGLAAQNSSTLVIGLGQHRGPVDLKVYWPSGRISTHADLATDAVYRVFENSADTQTGEAIVRQPYGAVDLARQTVPAKQDHELKSLVERDPHTAKLRMYTTSATWCSACKKANPDLALLRGSFSAEDLAMFGVPIDPEDTREKWAVYQDKYRPAYQILAGLEAQHVDTVKNLVMQELHGDALPATLICDSEGRLLQAMWQVPTVSHIRQALSQLEGREIPN